MKLEICTDTLTSSLIAEKAGADRIELCADLCIGGTTPSAGLIKSVTSQLSIPIAVMIRPRAGDFCYSDNELETMKLDIQFAKEAGAEAVVFGVLTSDGAINTHAMQSLIECARPMAVVCHRAFDMSQNAEQSLRQLVALGVDRLLTSGFANKAFEGLETIVSLAEMSKNDITIVVGSGISYETIPQFIDCTAIQEYHMSAKKIKDSQMTFRKHHISMGSASSSHEYIIEEASYDTIKKIKSLLNTYKKPIHHG